MSSTIGPVRAKEAVKFSERTDEELLLDYCQHRDRRSFEELVHRYERELFTYLRRYLGSAEMAEDAFQQTFLQVHLKCEQYEPGRKVRPWLYTVATNQAIDAQRRNRRHRMASLDRRVGNEGEAASGALVDMLVREEPGPTELLETTERRQFVQEVVDRLPEALKQVVVLVYYQGLKYREAAEVLDIPVGTVKSRLHAAIQKLCEWITPTNLPQ
jgi:RNA polymerase sigma-70 factor (ECF subfamily)